jgi:hypothetical protein
MKTFHTVPASSQRWQRQLEASGSNHLDFQAAVFAGDRTNGT